MSEVTFIRVSDVMSTDVKTISRLATVAEAISMFRNEKVSSLLVERADENE